MIAFGSVRQTVSMTPTSACIFAVSSLQAFFRAVSARGALAKAFRSDRPAALIEDAVASGGGLAIFCLLA